jgi:NAD(P)-dependent dehydrogenase (short-subunit alcohol dehydrogenase family)
MDLSNKTILLTGGTGGIGRQTAEGLAHLGARLIVIGRDGHRAEMVVAEMTRITGNTTNEAKAADVSQQSEPRNLADHVKERYERLDVLINNAAATRPRRELTPDGVETAFATNVMAAFSLTRLLLPAMGDGSRVINIAGGIPKGQIDLNNLQGDKHYVGLSF